MPTKKPNRTHETLQAMLAGALGFSGVAIEKPRSRDPFASQRNG